MSGVVEDMTHGIHNVGDVPPLGGRDATPEMRRAAEERFFEDNAIMSQAGVKGVQLTIPSGVHKALTNPESIHE